MNFNATKAGVDKQGQPPDSFLADLVQFGQTAPDEIFEADPFNDVYSLLLPSLGPWDSLLTRKAAMLEAMRVTAGFESSWNYSLGRDTTAGPETPEEMEAGAWQVSYNSINLDPTGSLKAFSAANGVDGPMTFQQQIKANHQFDIEYTARLLRFSTRWDGPMNRGWVAQWVSRASMAEFQTLLLA
jgi:hypothetical protein